MEPWMHEKEIKMIEKYISGKKEVLEWGCGGSTLHFPKFINGTYTTIEHNYNWYMDISSKVDNNVNCLFEKQNYEANGCSTYFQYRDYIEKPMSLKKKFDFVLIDGRGRQFCAEVALTMITEDAIVCIHDYFMKGRDRYKIVERWYNLIDSVKDTEQTLAVFHPKPEAIKAYQR